MTWIRVQMVCAAADVAASDALISDLWGSPQSGTMCVPLSATGGQPPTHFGSSGTYQPSQIEAIQEWVQGEPIRYAVCEGVDNELPSFDEYIAGLGLQIAYAPVPDG